MRVFPLLLLFAAVFEAQGAGTNHAQLKVSNYGLLGNRQLKKILQTLQPEKAKPRFYDANFIEDAALLLRSKVQRDGYLKPRIVARVTLDNNQISTFEWRDVEPE